MRPCLLPLLSLCLLARGAVPEEAALPTQATPYKPSVQRDPFATPQHERSAEGQDLLDDMTLKGFVRMGGKPFVVVSDRAGHVRWLGVGHRFTDAEITEVTEGHVTFQQWDPHNARRTAVRTIVKTFKREEGKP